MLNEYFNTARNADGTLMLDVKTDLKARDVTTLTDKQQALMVGYYAPGDGGGGQFYHDAAGADPGNGGTIIAPSAGGDGGSESSPALETFFLNRLFGVYAYERLGRSSLHGAKLPQRCLAVEPLLQPFHTSGCT